ncbi:MAG: acetyltransferase [Candidatus Omnitrophica bacterium]|nr:acetyltransferase [Candidatus Omnitrophota bacterium]
MDKERIILIGGGGHCKVVIDAVRLSGEYEIEGIIDPGLEPGSDVMGVPVLGGDEILAEVYNKGVKNAFIAVGSVGDCTIRKAIHKKIKGVGFNVPVIRHPETVVANDVELGEGSFVAASVTINTGTKIGENVIINTSSSIDHDCQIGDFAHISPGTILSGEVRIGDSSHIGAKSVVNQVISIGEECIIGSGSVVTRDIPSGSKAFGSPCKIRGRVNEG